MMFKLHSLMVMLLLCGGCVVAGDHQETTDLESWMQDAFKACVDAQLAIKNPFWDTQTKKPLESEVADYVVEFTLVPKVPVYHISISLKDLYPGALSLSCRLDAKTHTVMQAAYHQGEQSKEVNLVEHDPLAGIVEKELDSLVEKQEIKTIPLTKFYE